MPVLKVMKNGKHLCTIGSEDVWAFSASMSMDIWGPEISSLDISGGSKRNGKGESDFLIWEISHELSTQDKLSFSFEAGTSSSPKGRLFTPDNNQQEDTGAALDLSTAEKALNEMASDPAANANSAWSFSMNGASSIKVKPDSNRQHVMLHMIWNEDNDPEGLSLNLAKKSLQEIMDDSEGEVILSQTLPLGGQFQLAIES